MSLKVFHVFFISVCVLFSIGFGIWCLRNADHAGYTALGIGAFVVAAALVVYEIMFLRKTKSQ